VSARRERRSGVAREGARSEPRLVKPSCAAVVSCALALLACKAERSVPESSKSAAPVPSAPATPPANVEPAEPVPTVDPTIEGTNAFAIDLYSRLRVATGNVFFSPLSVSAALAMTFAGAHGETAAEMNKALRAGVDTAKTDPIEASAYHGAVSSLLRALVARADAGVADLRIANRIYGDKSVAVAPDFLTLTRERYDAPLAPVDFAAHSNDARLEINKWVAEQTSGRIKDLLLPSMVTAATRLVLVNAVWFKGTWLTRFANDQTKDEPFVVDAKTTTTVPTMHARITTGFGELEEENVLELSYVSSIPGRSLSMVIVLPKSADGLAKTEASFDAMRLSLWIRALQQRSVSVSLPRFRIETPSLDLRSALESMGIRKLFEKADLSRMAKGDLTISGVVHKAFVEVNEEGTEAAAATASVAKGGTAEPPREVVFKADHPFLFFVRDRTTQAVLFVGRVAKPQK
jgi:serpin B